MTKNDRLEPVWHACQIDVTTGTEERPRTSTVFGWATAEVPGLAITQGGEPGQKRRWSITHRQSGREIAEGMTEAFARRVTIAIAGLTDWTRPANQLGNAETIAAEVQRLVDRLARGGVIVDRSHRRKSLAEMLERKAVGALLDALKIHETRDDSTAAARIRGALSYLPQ